MTDQQQHGKELDRENSPVDRIDSSSSTLNWIARIALSTESTAAVAHHGLTGVTAPARSHGRLSASKNLIARIALSIELTAAVARHSLTGVTATASSHGRLSALKKYWIARIAPSTEPTAAAATGVTATARTEQHYYACRNQHLHGLASRIARITLSTA